MQELKIGVLAHDLPDLWSGFRVEEAVVAVNLEALLPPPALPFMRGTIRSAIGASIAPQGSTSDGYIDARWQMDTSSGLFFGLGLGGAIHNGH